MLWSFLIRDNSIIVHYDADYAASYVVGEEDVDNVDVLIEYINSTVMEDLKNETIADGDTDDEYIDTVVMVELGNASKLIRTVTKRISQIMEYHRY